MQPTTIGLDIEKHVFQAHGVDAAGQVVLRLRGGNLDGGALPRLKCS